MILYFLTDHPILSTCFYMSDTVMVNKINSKTQNSNTLYQMIEINCNLSV